MRGQVDIATEAHFTLIFLLACLSIQEVHSRLRETKREVAARYRGSVKKLQGDPG